MFLAGVYSEIRSWEQKTHWGFHLAMFLFFIGFLYFATY